MLIMQLQPFSVNDGDGIRTTIFLAGCPLRCQWCSNPEGWQQKPMIGWYRQKCIGCGACEQVCPQAVGIDWNAKRADCTACGACVAACPASARTYLVKEADPDEILKEIAKHRVFYEYSGGGITFSGGEATAQPEILEYLSSRIYDMGYSMDLETCGYFDFGKVEASLRRMDLIFMDLKTMDDAVHRKYTGVSNRKILENMKRLNDLPADIVIRIPVIGGVNDSEENIRGSADFVHANLPRAKMELLPLHKLGTVKYEALGMPAPYEAFRIPDGQQMDALRAIVREEGVELADYR